MKKRTKSILGVFGIIATLGILTSCNSFCSSKDSASYRYLYDPINTRFFNSEAEANSYVLNELSAKSKNTLTLDNKGTTELSADTVGTITVNVFVDGAKTEAKPLVDVASNFFTFDTTNSETPEANKIFEKINEGLTHTYFVRSSDVTIYEKTTKKGDNDKEEIVYSAVNSTFSKNGLIAKLEKEFRDARQNAPISQYWNDFDKKVLENVIIKATDGHYFDRFKEGGKLAENQPESLFELLYGFSNEAYNDYLSLKSAKAKEHKSVALIKGNTPYEFEDKAKDKDSFIGRENSLLAQYGYTKYVSTETENKVEASEGKYWDNIKKWNEEIRIEHLAVASNYEMSSDFVGYYQRNVDQHASMLRTCISIDEGFYGHFGDDPLNASIKLTNKSSWKDAWKHGFLEGLFVYPISYMNEYFAHAFGMNGWGQIGAVLLVTLIVRGLFMLITFKSTLSQQKMTALQPEIAKLQQKYPNSNTNQYEKQRLAQAQMALYKKHKIHPFSSLLIIIIQFPIFISVWNGFSGSASLTSDAVLGLRLSDTIWSALTNFNNWSGWGTAFVLILLMSAAQIISMQLPRWIQKKQMKNVSRTSKNPAETSSQKQMKWVSWIMTGFIIIMGFTLPAAMGVYWFAGALFSMIQTGIMQGISARKTGHKLAHAGNATAKKGGKENKNTVKVDTTSTANDNEVIEAEIVEKDEKPEKKGKKKGK